MLLHKKFFTGSQGHAGTCSYVKGSHVESGTGSPIPASHGRLRT